MWGKEPVGAPFSLTDHTGRARTDRDFLGKLVLLYFGYTHCPDACPTDALELTQDFEMAYYTREGAIWNRHQLEEGPTPVRYTR